MASSRRIADLPEFDEIVVHDGLEPCPYIEGLAARMPLRLQLRYDPERFDRLLAEGDRRVGQMLYRPSCPHCDACVDVRVPLATFTPSRSQRRVWRRNSDLELTVARPRVDETRLALFNRHKVERGLGGQGLTPEGYTGWLVRTCADTVELSWRMGEELIAVTVLDVGEESVSAVYTYFDPDHSERSLGTFAVLAAIEWARSHGLRYLYLGLLVEQNRHLNYKARFTPQERLRGGRWVPYSPRAD